MSYGKRRDHIFFYNGNAVALGGYIESDGSRTPIASVAPAVVPIVGGSSHAHHKGYCFPERSFFKKAGPFTISVKHAESEVYGKEVAGGYVTVARSRLENLNVNDIIKADLVESVLESVHRAGPSHGDEGEVRVFTAERKSRIEGLTIAGVTVET